VRRRVLYAKLLALRAVVLMPQLEGAQAMAAPRGRRCGCAGALAVGRRLGAHHRLQSRARALPDRSRPDGRLLFESRASAGEQALHGRLEGRATVVFLEPPG